MISIPQSVFPHFPMWVTADWKQSTNTQQLAAFSCPCLSFLISCSCSSFLAKICSSCVSDLFLVSGKAIRAKAAPRRRVLEWRKNMPSIPIRLVR